MLAHPASAARATTMPKKCVLAVRTRKLFPTVTDATTISAMDVTERPHIDVVRTHLIQRYQLTP
ncbi:hypothetical protein Rhow_000407 [Rhodococcus wratislaviensis]|uniref:Uncharacterized protein n=1 Tax=Rhodococcus wratislaviensis TaxID=44752 RepID=A0A402C246_RHOWR|nr:hypothetical protein Rhow_000407 [Rhodococcus wratislaviensis]